MNIGKSRSFIRMILGKLNRWTNSVSSKLGELYLILVKGQQKAVFQRLRYEFRQVYDRLKETDSYYLDQFCEPAWRGHASNVENIFRLLPRFDFLRNNTIRYTMVFHNVKVQDGELNLIESIYSVYELRRFLIEDYIGRPLIFCPKYHTSSNSIHHLYHLVRFSIETNTDLKSIVTVIEWGGGYGNFCKIFRRINPESTYIIIDLSIFTCIQWLYLSTVVGTHNVHILFEPIHTVIPGKINLIPIGLIRNLKLECDLFIATWSLSESTKFSQEFIKDHMFFNTKHLLMTAHKNTPQFPNSENLIKIAMASGVKLVPIEFLPGCQYVFK